MQFARNTDRYQVPVFRHASLDDIAGSSIANGIHNFAYGDGNLDILVEDNGSAVTLIFFHGAVAVKNTTLPVLGGRSVGEGLGGNIILVSDPALERGVNLGWFAGDKGRELQTHLPALLQNIMERMQHHRFAVTYGGSGGGFASLFYAAQLENSLAVVGNPQTNILNYVQSVVDRYAKSCWGTTDLSSTGIVTNVIDLYRDEMPTNVIYLQALGDLHVRRHMVPFLEEIYDRDAVGVKMIRNGQGHRPPPKPLIRSVLKHAVMAEGEWSTLVQKLDLDLSSSPSQLARNHRAFLKELGDPKIDEAAESEAVSQGTAL